MSCASKTFTRRLDWQPINQTTFREPYIHVYKPRLRMRAETETCLRESELTIPVLG